MPPKTPEYPAFICHSCGTHYGRRPQGNPNATWHLGTCDICRTYTHVTEPRDFGHLKPGWENHDQAG